MSLRGRQCVLVLILLSLVAVLAWGCGSDPEPTTTTTTPVPTSPTTGKGENGAAALIGTQLRTTEDTPAEYVEAVKAGQPVVLLFYVAAGVDDQRVLENVAGLQPEFPDYAFLIYDSADPEAYGDLSMLLRVDYPPALILVDGTGTIDAVWNGYVDVGTLNQSLVNLGA